MGGSECLIYEVLFIKDTKSSLNTQTILIRDKFSTWLIVRGKGDRSKRQLSKSFMAVIQLIWQNEVGATVR